MTRTSEVSGSGLVEGIRAGNVAALARAITLVENGREGYETLLSALHPQVGRARRIGVTGPPGAGKSTLVERLVQRFRAQDRRVAVVAVDPTSPFTGGALLGDRIRMESVTLDPGVYIRSMATRGAVGGLATTTREVCDVLDAFGFERILIETVGVGQSELAIAGSADSAVLVLVPESGDGVQVLKAGVMEIADLYVVNKADRPGADRLVHEIEVMLGLRQGVAYRETVPHHRAGEIRVEGEAPASGWAPPVLRTVAIEGQGVDDLMAALDAHHDALDHSGGLAARRRTRLEQHTREVVDRAVSAWMWRARGGEELLRRRFSAVVSGQISPYRLAHEIIARLNEDDTHGQ